MTWFLLQSVCRFFPGDHLPGRGDSNMPNTPFPNTTVYELSRRPAAIAQLGERCVRNAKVGSSSAAVMQSSLEGHGRQSVADSRTKASSSALARLVWDQGVCNMPCCPAAPWH